MSWCNWCGEENDGVKPMCKGMEGHVKCFVVQNVFEVLNRGRCGHVNRCLFIFRIHMAAGLQMLETTLWPFKVNIKLHLLRRRRGWWLASQMSTACCMACWPLVDMLSKLHHTCCNRTECVGSAMAYKSITLTPRVIAGN